jgi:hypothetical protein
MNKFIVNEDEKNRILGMHKQAIKESFNKELSEQVPPKTPNTQAVSDDSKRKEIYNADFAKWKTYFNFSDKTLIAAREAVESGQIKDINQYMLANFKSIVPLMERVMPQAWQSASASSYKKFGNYVGQQPGSAWPTIVNYIIDLKNYTLALIREKAGMPVQLPKDTAQYIMALKSLGIQYPA